MIQNGHNSATEHREAASIRKTADPFAESLTNSHSPRQLPQPLVSAVQLMLGLFVTISPPCCLVGNTQSKKADVVFYSLSIQVGQLSRPDATHGLVNTFLTTFDGNTNVPPLTQDVGGGLIVTSQELRPRSGQPGVYEADYIETGSSGVIGYGSLTFALASPDADQNGIPDLVQLEKGVNADMTGLMQADVPKVLIKSLKGHIFRAPNSSSGTITYFDSAGGKTNFGNFFVPNSAGTLTYSRGVTNVLSLSLLSTNNIGSVLSSTSSSKFDVKVPDQIALGQLIILRSDNTKVTNYASSLTRIGKSYIGTIEAADGNLQTSWRDLTHRTIQITDNNDADQDGIPDFSDDVMAVSLVKFTSISRLQNRQIQLKLEGPAGKNLTVLTSHNLVDWLPVITLANPSGVLEFIDPGAGSVAAKFYKIELEAD